jgi:TldD protein
MKAEWEIGKKVASEVVSIVDCGDDPTNTGYCPIDDEGNLSRKTYLINKGTLSGRLHSGETAESINEEITGNARAINFEFEPIVRMTNTYFEAGNLTFDELIKPIENGYLIKTVTHGSGMSTFTLAVNRAYKIENGKVTDPVKINVATGSVFQTLHDIDGASDKVEIKSSVMGGCGKGGQFPLAVSYGGPYLRIRALNIS